MYNKRHHKYNALVILSLSTSCNAKKASLPINNQNIFFLNFKGNKKNITTEKPFIIIISINNRTIKPVKIFMVLF